MARMEISKQAFAELKDRLEKSDFDGLNYEIRSDDLGEFIWFHGMQVQASQGFDNQEVKELKAEIRRLQSVIIDMPKTVTEETLREAIFSVQAPDGSFKVSDIFGALSNTLLQKGEKPCKKSLSK